MAGFVADPRMKQPSPIPEWLQNMSSYLVRSPMALIDPIGSTLRTYLGNRDWWRSIDGVAY